MSLDKISLSSLSNYSSMNEFLNELGTSKNQQKKYLAKKLLSKKVNSKQELSLPIDLINTNRINPLYDGPEIEIVYNDELFIAVNKPPSIHCHPLSYSEKDNVLSFLQSHMVLENNTSYDRTLLYRLDYETSGILVLAKDKSDYETIREEFHDLVKSKIYYAIVQGHGLIVGKYSESFSGSGPKGHKQKQDPDGQYAKLEILEVHEHDKENISLVKIKLETGIRHQIRVQLASLGYPLLGDTLYGGDKAQRVFLHAFKYDLKLGNKAYEFKCTDMKLFDLFFDLNRCS